LPDDEIQNICDAITGTLEGAFELLIERRETALAAALKPRGAEAQSLRQEYAALEEAKRNLEALLPARAREAQREADALLLSGKAEQAEMKLAEARQASEAPATMTQRQGEISARIEEIQAEERTIAREVFERWVAEDVPPVVRAVEHALFVVVLERF